MNVMLSDEDLARELQDDYYYSLTSEEQKAETRNEVREIIKEELSTKSIWSIFFPKPQLVIEDDPTITPEHYRDCTSEKQKIRWIQSPAGQAILSRRPVLLEFYKNGRIFQMIKSEHWTVRLNEWLHDHEAEKVPFGLTLPMNSIVKEQMKNRWIHTPHANPPLDQLFSDHSYSWPVEFPTQNKYEMLINRFTIFRNIIPQQIVDNAQAAINHMIVSNESFGDTTRKGKTSTLNEDPFFTSGVTNDKHVLALFYQSPVYALVEALLHANSSQLHGDVKKKGGTPSFHNYTQGAQVAYRFSEARRAHHHLGSQKLGGLGWHIDGMDRGQFGSFSLLIGFPLSDQHQDFSGNLCLHAGSHHVLNATYVKPYAEKCLAINGGKEPAEQQEVHIPKPKLDEPVQIKAGRGDVVFVLHRVGHRGGPNYSNQVRKMVYIRVSHRQHAANKMRSLDDLWLDYEGMQEVL
jgi:hypothetical protein